MTDTVSKVLWTENTNAACWMIPDVTAQPVIGGQRTKKARTNHWTKSKLRKDQHHDDMGPVHNDLPDDSIDGRDNGSDNGSAMTQQQIDLWTGNIIATTLVLDAYWLYRLLIWWVRKSINEELKGAK